MQKDRDDRFDHIIFFDMDNNKGKDLGGPREI